MMNIKAEIAAKVEKRVEDRERAVWSAWQTYYRENLYVPSEETHETAVAQLIMIAKSPSEALRAIEAYHRKHPSSVGADAGEEFRILYHRTRDAVSRRKGVTLASGWIQTVRETHTGE